MKVEMVSALALSLFILVSGLAMAEDAVEKETQGESQGLESNQDPELGIENQGQRDTEALDDLRKRYPGADLKDAQWLREHPEIAKEVLKNRAWLNEHPEAARKMFQEREWLAKHPEVAEGIYGNRRWLHQHPEVAKEIYANRRWLADHPEFARDAEAFWKRHPHLRSEIRDRREDIRNRREDIRDRREDVRDQREDIRDRREDVRDRHEDTGDRRENISDPQLQGQRGGKAAPRTVPPARPAGKRGR